MNTLKLNARNKIATCVTSVLLFGMALTSTTVSAASIGRTMKSMKIAYNDAMDASSMSEFAQAMGVLQNRSQEARSLGFDGTPDEQATYRKGMSLLQQEIASAMAADDLGAAKAALLRIRTIEKQYHNALR